MQIKKWLRNQGKSLLLLALFVLIIVSSDLPLTLWTRGPDSSKSFRVSVRIDKNGLPTLFGVHLGKGSFRNFVFRTLRITGMRVKLVSVEPQAYGSETNLAQTLRAVNAADRK